MLRIIAAFVLVPLLYPISLLVGYGRDGLAAAQFVGSVTVPGMLLLGVPFFLVARRANWLQWWQFCLGGCVLGLILAALALIRGWEVALFFAPFFSVAGTVHAGAVWVFGVWRNTGLTRRSSGPPSAAAELKR